MRLLLLLCLTSLCSCALRTKDPTPSKPPTHSFFTASDDKQLSLRHWNLQKNPKTVLIGLHGIEGAARDFGNLGKALSQQSPSTTLYALNLRGAGYDPDPRGRGNIRSATLWKRDLLELQECLKEKHPSARFIWLGESMGSLIAMNAATETSLKPAGMVLVSPVVSLAAIPTWQVNTLRLAALIAPGARVSLESLAGGSFQATTSSDHFLQSVTNPYHVEKYTLRFLSTLATLSQSMDKRASRVSLPTLILHGSKDYLTSSSQIQHFANAFSHPPEIRNFESSHHLLFYDSQRKEVVSAILQWLAKN